MKEKIPVGVIGCGNISGIYFENMVRGFENLDVRACADLVMERAEAKAAEYPGVRAMSVDALLADPALALVVNLTLPGAHEEVAHRAIEAGKSVYNEKPLALTRAGGEALLNAARRRKVLVGGAPDTFLGAGLQTCRRLMDDGAIGEPVAATAFMVCHGHEHWHPSPEFYYRFGGGPMFDMGPYYLTALVALIGPVTRVAGMTRVTFPERTITSEAKRGRTIRVEVPTHVAGVMEFGNGAIGTLITSFDVWAAQLPRIEIYGTEGSLSVPDPNTFGGPVRLKRAGDEEWRAAPLSQGYAENSRGLGVADMAAALLGGRPPRAGGLLAYHVLDVMHAFHEASDKGQHVRVRSSCERPAALPPGCGQAGVFVLP